MILQAFEGLSDREAVDRLGFDLRWQAAAGVAIGAEAFHPTVLVGAATVSEHRSVPDGCSKTPRSSPRRPERSEQRARVLDSTPIYDAVATEDTVTQLRAVIRKLLVVLDQAAIRSQARCALSLLRDDEYATPGKPPCDWDDRAAREALVDALVNDANAALEC